jgi:hypothetical protein
MSIIETAGYCPFCNHGELGEGYRPLFSGVSQGGAELVMDTSALVRGAVGTLDTIENRDDPAMFSALGFTTVFSAICGVSTLHKGWHESNLMKRIGDATGRMLANLKCFRGAIQTTAGLLFIPVRALGVAASVTASKTYAAIAGTLGIVGNSLFGMTGVMLGFSALIEIQEQASLMSELYAAYGENADAQACLTLLQEKLALSPEEALESDDDQQNLLDKKKSILARAIGAEAVEALEHAGAGVAVEIVNRVFAANQKALIFSSLTCLLCAVGIVATLIPILSNLPVALIAASGLNAFTSAIWLILDCQQLHQAFQNHEPGRFDKLLLTLVSLGCIAAIGIAGSLGTELIVQGCTIGLGIVWFLILLATTLKTHSS